MRPQMGYNAKKYNENYDKIFRREYPKTIMLKSLDERRAILDGPLKGDFYIPTAGARYMIMPYCDDDMLIKFVKYEVCADGFREVKV